MLGGDRLDGPRGRARHDGEARRAQLDAGPQRVEGRPARSHQPRVEGVGDGEALERHVAVGEEPLRVGQRGQRARKHEVTVGVASRYV
jgi:hypothetical protein